MREQIKQAYGILSSLARMEECLRNLSFIYTTRKFFKYLRSRIKIFNAVNQCYYHLLLTKAQYYQPLYNFSVIQHKKPERICIDRADAIYQEIKAQGSHKRILDIGCNLGYFSFYFAERGHQASGIDTNPKNIKICKLLQKINQATTDFRVAEFSGTFIDQIQPGQYDMCFLFSVAHHLVCAKGMEYTQNLMKQLLEKIPLLFIELATNKEATSSPWRSCITDDELAIFLTCEKLNIQKLGNFPTNVKGVLRPLYKIALA